MAYITKKSKRDFILFIIVVLLSISFVFAQSVKPLRNTRYSWRELKKKGYTCTTKFKGRKFITYDRYMELITFKTITK